MIQVSHLSKRYGDLTAVDDLSFTFGDGHVYRLLGPNGAGKSTTMNIMTGCLSPTEGTVRIGGFDIREEPRKAKRLLGYLPEQPPLYLGETPEEYLQFVGAAKGLRGRSSAARWRTPWSGRGCRRCGTSSSAPSPRATASVWALPRPFWESRRSSSWMSPPWAWTPCRSSRSGS